MARVAASCLLLTAGLLSACHGARPAEPVVAAGPVRFQETPAPAAPVRTAQGVLALDSRGCLRVGATAVLWPQEAGLDISRPGQVRIYADDGPPSASATRWSSAVSPPPRPPTAPARPSPPPGSRPPPELARAAARWRLMTPSFRSLLLAGLLPLAACAGAAGERRAAAVATVDPAAAALPANAAPPAAEAEAAVPSAPAITDDKARPPSPALEAATYQCTDGSTVSVRYDDAVALLTKGEEKLTLQARPRPAARAMSAKAASGGP
jgi:hypothetical protein